MSYMTRDQMIATFAAYETNYPNLVKSEVIGQTVEGRSLKLYKIGNPANGTVMFSAGTHSHEIMSVEVLKLLCDYILTSNEPDAVRIRQRNYVLVLPVLCLDGYPNYTEGVNMNCVNLYRNLDFHWADPDEYPEPHAYNPNHHVWTCYAGPYAESEPETQALLAAWAKFLPRHYVDMHCGTSAYKLWYTWLADAVDKQMMVDGGIRYKARGDRVGVGTYPVEENTDSCGCAVSASYHRNSKKIFGWVNEIGPRAPTYASIASTYWPAWKSVAIQLCQESEYVDANVHIMIDDREIDPGEVRLLRVHLGKTNEVSSFELELNNPVEKYSFGGTEPFALGDSVVLYVGRKQYSPLLFTGTLETPRFHAEPNNNYVLLTGRCLGEKWFRRKVTKKYAGQKGEAVIKDVLDSFVGLTHVRNAVELVENCSTTYTLLGYDYKPAFDILKELCRDSDLSGVIGFDGRVAPDGLFEWFPVGSKTNSIDITEEANEGDYEIGIPAIKNKIWIHGYKLPQNKKTIVGTALQCRCFPVEADLFTVDSLTNWTCEAGTHSIETTFKIVGANSYRVDPVLVVAIYQARFKRYWATTPLAAAGLDGFSSLNFWMRWDASGPYYTEHKLQLLAPDESNYFYTDLTEILNGRPNWVFLQRDIGPEYEYDADKNAAGKWTKVGNADWYNIQGIRVELSGALTPVPVYLDGLHFGHARFRFLVPDDLPAGDFKTAVLASQSAYGVREEQETNDELYSDHECEMAAKALADWLKDPFPETIALKFPELDYGMTPILAADKKHVHLPNEKVDSDWVVDNAVYEVLGPNELIVSLNFGRQKARIADYFYANREILKRLGKLKQSSSSPGSVG